MALSLCGKRILVVRNILSNCKRCNGYIVLVPEIAEEATDKNALLKDDGLPEFNAVTIENCMAVIAKQTLYFEAGVQKIEQTVEEQGCNDIFKDVFEPIERLGADLDLAWGLSKTLYLGNSSAMPVKSYLAIHDRAKRARASKYNSQVIYKNVKEVLNNNNTQDKKTPEQLRVLKKFALEGNLNGLDLLAPSLTKLQEHLNKLTEERVKLKQKIEIATNRFSHNIEDSTIIRDFPQKLLAQMSWDSGKPLTGPWKVTLQPNIYKPVLELCPDREVRWNIWQALVTRGSGYTDKDLSTSQHLETIRGVRADIAKTLGFETFADMSMQTKMAGSVDNVQLMLQSLLRRTRPAQFKEVEDLYNFALERGFKSERLELWDVPYWRRKQMRTLYDFDETAYKDYFPLNKVLDGLFELIEKLFKVVIRKRTGVSGWNNFVQFYDVFEPETSAPIAGFYFDPYATEEERIKLYQGNGWMVGIQNHSLIANTKPLAALIFNFERPKRTSPCLLSYKEVKQLFHKFGQTLQHLLSKTTYSEVSGLSNIEWDAVQISGYFLTHWLQNKSVMDSISAHYNSECKLPENMFEALVHSEKHMAGMDLSREIYLSALDLELHSSRRFWLEIVKDLWERHSCFPLHKIDSHPCSFTQVFIDEWAAAYYSQLWSRMIAADVYSAFHEVKGDEQQIVDIGKRFRDTFLALGGSHHPNQVFRQFRGRDPSPKALLSSLGIKRKSKQ